MCIIYVTTYIFVAASAQYATVDGTYRRIREVPIWWDERSEESSPLGRSALKIACAAIHHHFPSTSPCKTASVTIWSITQASYMWRHFWRTLCHSVSRTQVNRFCIRCLVLDEFRCSMSRNTNCESSDLGATLETSSRASSLTSLF